MPEKEVFQKGDIVDVKNREFTYGKIVKIKGDKAVVHFKKPRRPKICEKCGIGIMLLLNMSTGEVECLRSGCGHGHGFEEREETIPLSQLINITQKRNDEEREKIAKEIMKILIKAKKLYIISDEDEKKIIEFFS